VRGLIVTMMICGTFASADTINLRTGEVVQGTYMGGTSRQIQVAANGNVQTFDVSQVQSVTFVDPNYAPGPPSQDSYTRDQNRGYNPPPGAQAPQAYGVTVPADTPVTIRMADSVNSETARLGQTFRASLDEPSMVNGQELASRGADIVTKLVQDLQSGKIEGRTVLTLALDSISFNGQLVRVTSSDVKTESSSRGARSAGVVGGGTALGAIVGALAGGGKGAAIGAVSGAAIGGSAEVLTKGQTVKIPSETRLTFRLRTPVQL